jgi:hypothetical protein
MTNPKERRKTDLDITSSGNSIILEISDYSDFGLHIRGDASEPYSVDVRDADEGSWMQDVETFSGTADYDSTSTRPEAWVRVRNTGGNGTGSDTADVYISAS